jgi:Ca2+-binding RTX toxin-like protein
MRGALLTLAVGVLGGGVAPAVIAATVDVQERGIGGLKYEAKRGETNRLTISYGKGRFNLVDRGARIVEREKGCRKLGRGRLRCKRPRTAAPNLLVKLLDGNDRLKVKAGRRGGYTTVYAGAGNDVIRVGSGSVYGTVNGEGGSDHIVVGRIGHSNQIDGGEGPDVSVGGPGKDEIYDTGNGGSDASAQNNDRLDGRDGNDVIVDDFGNDVLLGGTGNDRVNGGRGDDVLVGGPGKDTLGSSAAGPGEGVRYDLGADKFDGGEGDDVLNGLEGDRAYSDTTPEPDQISCGPGHDRVVVDQLDTVASDCEEVDRMPQSPPPFAAFSFD